MNVEERLKFQAQKYPQVYRIGTIKKIEVVRNIKDTFNLVISRYGKPNEIDDITAITNIKTIEEVSKRIIEEVNKDGIK